MRVKNLKKLQKLLAKIPRGNVATYRTMARAMGIPGGYRYIGNLLHSNPDPDKFPCYKIVKSNGLVGGYAEGTEEKIRRLRGDGVIIKEGKVMNFSKCLFTGF